MKKLLFIALVLLTTRGNGQFISPLQSVTAVVHLPKVDVPEVNKKATYSPELYVQNKKTDLSRNDTTITVYYKNKPDNNQIEPMYVVNGKPISELGLHTIDPSKIEAINMEKVGRIRGENGKKYMAKIALTLKKDYIPSFISVHKLLEKHTSLGTTKTIIFIDNTLINKAYNSVIIDEKYVMSITVDQLDRSVNGLDITVVRITLRTKENIEQKNHIRIRGVAQYRN